MPYLVSRAGLPLCWRQARKCWTHQHIWATFFQPNLLHFPLFHSTAREMMVVGWMVARYYGASQPRVRVQAWPIAFQMGFVARPMETKSTFARAVPAAHPLYHFLCFPLLPVNWHNHPNRLCFRHRPSSLSIKPLLPPTESRVSSNITSPSGNEPITPLTLPTTTDYDFSTSPGRLLWAISPHSNNWRKWERS